MGKIRMRSTSISDNPSLQSPVFHFSPYLADGEHTYYNNENVIDFVTDGNSLYVCLSHDGVTPTYENIEDNSDFLKIVSQGPQGIRGPRGHDGDSAETPRLNAEFDNDQLRVYVNGELETVSPRLTGKAWRPKLEDNMIVWELSNRMYSPEPIDLEELRPTQEKPLLLRVDSDNTKRSDETSGPAGFIQWKYEGDPHWTNLISISELMNLTLAGVSIWKNDEGKWHFGHKKVIGATYESDKAGNRIISKVELGDVLFDAGELPFEENSETRPDYSIDIDLIYSRLAEIEGDMVKSVNGFGPDGDGNVNINIPTLPSLEPYAQKDWVNSNYQPKGSYLTEHQSLDGLVRKVKVNGTTHSPVDGTVDLGNIGGNGSTPGTPVDTSDCVKAITINNVTKTPDSSNNGHLVFTIDVDGNPLFDVRFDSTTHKLQKTTDGQTWLDLVDLDDYTGGTGGGLTTAQVKSLIEQTLAGLLDPLNEYDNGKTGHNYFVRINELNSILSNYYTKSQVYSKGEIDQMITGGETSTLRTFMIFKRSASRESETLPTTAITWNISEGVLDIPAGSNGWTEHPDNASDSTPYLWVAYGTFESLHGSLVGNWDGPFCLTGADGKDGEDGNGIEFIYHLGPMGANGARPTAPSIDYTKSKNYNDNTTATRVKSWWSTEESEDSCPGDGNNGYWTDDPQGIDDTENAKVEWASVRRSHYDSTSKTTVWEDFCRPFIWSMWGEDGVDGAGVEYIFCVTTSEAEEPIISALIPRIGQTYDNFDATFPDYQSDDWYPKDGQGHANRWTDNPLSVSENQPYEWVAIRKRVIDPVTKKSSWGYFSDPKVWGLWGQQTITNTIIQDGSIVRHPYTCYAFTRTNIENFVSKYVVRTTWEYVGQTFAEWIAEDPNREVDFYDSPLDYLVTLVTSDGGQTWRIPVGNEVIEWHDTIPSGSDQLYLISNVIGDELEEETEWDGPTKWGDQAGFQTEYALSNEKTDAVYDKTKTLPTLNNRNYINEDGTVNEQAWRTAVESEYGVWRDDNELEDPVYMATCYKKSNGVWSTWTVTKIKGENGKDGINGTPGSDGKSVEFVYYRTKGAEPGIEFVNELERGTYDLETASIRNKVDKDPELDDFFPAVVISGEKTDGDYWHDHPKGVNETYTHEWVATRTSAIQDGRRYWTSNFSIALWSKFGENGRDGDGIEYVFWGLSESDVAKINTTWPTQKTNVNTTSNVVPSRKDGKRRSITDNEYLPAIIIDNAEVEAVDNNPGIANNQYVFASMRRFNGSSHTWGEFSEIKLWNEQNSSTLENIVLDITDDKHQILVDENGVIKDSDLQFRCNTSAMCLYKDLVLLGNGKVLVNNVVLAQLNPAGTGTNTMSVTNNTATVESNGVTASVIATSAYKNEDSNTSSINLRVTFQSNTVLNDAFVIPITVVDTTDTYSAVDSLSIVPTLYKGPELTHVPNVQKTSGEGTHDYGQTDLSFWGTPIYGTLEQVMPTEYWFGYDGKTSVNFKLTAANKTALRALDDGTAIHHENFYFDRSGNQISSSSAYYFRIQINNSDYNDNLDPYRKWTSTGYVRLSSFNSNANEQTENYPIDEMLFGIGVDGVCTDDATVYIVYPGKNGDPGQPGQPGQPGEPGQPGKYKKELYCLGTTSTYDGKWQSSYKSTGATISTLTSSPNAWSETKPTVTSSKPHIWMTRADVTIGSESTQTCIWEEPTRITPVDGNVTHTYEYLAGTIMRTSEWSAGTTDTTKYWNGNTRVVTTNGVETQSLTDEGIKYLDVVSVTTTTDGVTKTSWYKCFTNHTKTSTSPATDSTNWREFSIMGDTAFHNLLVENEAYIENLTSKQVVITDNGNIVAGMTSGTIAGTDLEDEEITPGNIRIWAGATTNGNLATAPFNVDASGSVKASDIDLAGGSISGYLNMGSNGGISLDGGGSSSNSYLRSDGLSVVGQGTIASVSGSTVSVRTIPTGGVDVQKSIEITNDNINKVTKNMLNGNTQRVPVLWGSLNELTGIEIVTTSEYTNMSKNATTLYIVVD